MSSVFIEVLIVLARAEFAILLFDKEEGGCLRGVRKPYLLSSQVLVKEILSCFLLIWGEWIDFAYLRHNGLV